MNHGIPLQPLQLRKMESLERGKHYPLSPSSPVGRQSTIGDVFPGWGSDKGYSYIGLKGPAMPVTPHDAVKSIIGLDREKFAAANAAKKKVHCWHGAPGTLTSKSGFVDYGPCVLPWTAHFVVFCPIMFAPQMVNMTCMPHRDMEWPEWGDKALLYTVHGVVGKTAMKPNAETHAILWSGFDVDEVEVHQYGEPHTKGCLNMCTTSHNGFDAQPVNMCTASHNSLDARPVYDPLTIPLLVGLCLPCAACICRQPDKSQNLYHLKIKSTHTTTKSSGDNEVTYPTASVNLIALAPSAEECLEELRSHHHQAERAVVAPNAFSMVRAEEPAAGPQLRFEVCSVM